MNRSSTGNSKSMKYFGVQVRWTKKKGEAASSDALRYPRSWLERGAD